MRPVLSVVLLLGCGGSANPVGTATPAGVSTQPQEAETQEPVDPSGVTMDAQVLELVIERGQFFNWTVAPLRQYQRGETTVLVVWPMLEPDGGFGADHALAFVVRPDSEGTLVIEGPSQDVLEMTSSDLTELLGGNDYTVTPPAGLALDDIGPTLESASGQFCRALEASNSEAAIPEVSRLASVYPRPKITPPVQRSLRATRFESAWI